jgi:hypothetical protein
MFRPVLLICVLLATTGSSFPWGLLAHRIVTEAAAERLPPDVAPFFRKISPRLQELSLEPDTVLRARAKGDEEARRHFINLDAYEPFPFTGIPREYERAQERYGEAKVGRNGTLPWRIAGVLKDLTAAMRGGDAPETARQAGYLSHYVADAYQPLHLTVNHDGRETCNAGVHHAFESAMIERRQERYRDALRRSRGAAEAIEKPLLYLFNGMRERYALVARILEADTAALNGLKSERKDYWEELDRRAGPIAEREMSEAATAVASFWYTAWLDAGRPPLPLP